MLQVRLIGAAVAVMAASVLASVGFSWVFAQKWGRPNRRVATDAPVDHGLAAEAVTFSSDDVELAGWFIPARQPHAPTVVVAHGWGSDATRMLPVAAMLHDRGFAVLVHDVRGHGASPARGPITLLTFAQDLTAAVDHLNQRSDVDAKRIGVVGHSMGGAAALVAAATDPRIRAVVSSSAFADPVILTERTLHCLRIPRWPFLPLIRFFVERYLGTTMDDIAPRNRISDITVPVLLLHGSEDEFVPATDMAVLYGAADPATTQHVLISGRAHRDVLEDLEYWRRTLEFLDDSLAPHLTASATM